MDDELGIDERNSGDETTDAEEDLIATQTEKNIYLQIDSKFGTLDRDDFKKKMCLELDAQNLKDIRLSLHDLAKLEKSNYPVARIVERTVRCDSAPLDERLAEDIFILYHFLAGDNNLSELKSLASRHKQRTGMHDSSICASRVSKRKETNKQSQRLESEQEQVMQKSECNSISTLLNDKDDTTATVDNLYKIIDLKHFIQDSIQQMKDDIRNELKTELDKMRKELHARDVNYTRLQSDLERYKEEEKKLSKDNLALRMSLKEKNNQLEDVKGNQLFLQKLLEDKKNIIRIKIMLLRNARHRLK
ncbi:hypothetical protein ACJMK2_003575 [Sinanodonta woodiana]|uniref:CARD domain-containing protein n=1 Tax=Sinanodonta woodiana TaxID=1069815 RepID=A0ABD3Y1Y5_SINWO